MNKICNFLLKYLDIKIIWAWVVVVKQRIFNKKK